MRLSNERIKSLQALLYEKYGLELTDEQTQEAGFAIMRFVIAKAQRKQELTKEMEINYGQQKCTKRNYAR
jgi:hypothetical protein